MRNARGMTPLNVALLCQHRNLASVLTAGSTVPAPLPPLRRTGDVEADVLKQIATGLRIKPDAIKASQWIDNGPGWMGARLASAERVRSLRPDFVRMRGLKLGVVERAGLRNVIINGDFRINLTAAKGTGRGTYMQTAASYTGTVGYPDVGAAHPPWDRFQRCTRDQTARTPWPLLPQESRAGAQLRVQVWAVYGTLYLTKPG